jgi:Mn-dependent DtxR family transcriptional regulator
MPRKIGVDVECYRLAEHFLDAIAGRKPDEVKELAERIQSAVEDYFGEKDGQ